ncbi:hypothetical protein [Paraburkholderia sp. J41]|uniref:hypothetical protein n=1 Tax=Paraburkholderia sp. J41 TaxID=2805433 RepID=UPI002AC36F8B|nr:hypothetical protein [Paraburkholderia sp. J41]
MKKPLAWYVCAVVTCANAVTSLAFSLVLLAHGRGEAGDLYSAARTFCLAIAAILGAGAASLDVLFVLSPLLGAIQACDAIVGWLLHDIVKTIGPAVFSALTFASVIWLARHKRAEPD